MLKICSLLFLVFISSTSVPAQQFPVAPTPDAVVFADVTVVDVMSGKRRRGMTVIVRGDRIAEVGRSRDVRAPENANVVDARGKFLIPGLWDMHVHAWDADAFYPVILANGVTGIRDMGDDAKSLAAFRRQIESGTRLGPRLFFSGQILDGLRRETVPFLFSYVGTADEARAAVRRLKEGGADFIKVYNALTPDAYAAVAEEAKRQNLPFAGHVPVSVGVRAASLAGQRTVEHLSGVARACSADEEELTRRAEELQSQMRRLDDDRMKETGDRATESRRKTYEISNQLYELTGDRAFDNFAPKKCAKLYELFRSGGTWQVPTLAVGGGNSQRPESERTAMAGERIRYFPEFVRGMILQNGERLPAARLALNEKRFQTKLRVVRDMHSARVPLLAGSDAPNPGVYPGFSLHDELELLVRAGLSPLAALQTATLNPAVYFGKLPELGTVERNKLADLVLLDADPLDDIVNTRKIRAVVANGKLLSRADLDKMLANAAAKYQKSAAAPK